MLEAFKPNKKGYLGFKNRVGKTIKVAKHQTGWTIIPLDKERKALKPGKRLSKNGKIYYEYRRNRSDKNLRRRL